MTQFSFNLVDEAWLPCIRLDGTAALLSLRETLTQAQGLQTLAGDSPPQTAALHRLLLAVLHRIFGPKDEDAWTDLWQAAAFDEGRINEYLDAWRHRFDLFDAERPFYQADDSRVRTKSTISLSHDRASGNNATLFDHHTEATGESLTPAQAARVLVTGQAYGLAGLSGIKEKFTDGTCAGGIIFLVKGDTLKDTLLLNMIPYPTDDAGMFLSSETDKPAWEMDNPFEPERAYPQGYLDYLTWQNRRVLFTPELWHDETVVRTMTMGPALRFEPTIHDPMKHYRRDDKLGAIAHSFSEDRVLWRDSAAFFTFDNNSGRNVIPPATFWWLRELSQDGLLERHYRYRCMALGMSKKQAKVFFFREEHLPLPISYLTNDQLVNRLADALAYTSKIAFDLVQAVRLTGMYLQIPDADNKKWGELNSNAKAAINDWVAHTASERHYWTNLDIPFQTFMVTLAQQQDADGREIVLRQWLERLQTTVHSAYDQAAQCVSNDARSLKAIMRGSGYLHYRLAELISVEAHEES